jgi:hypothetical protein
MTTDMQNPQPCSSKKSPRSRRRWTLQPTSNVTPAPPSRGGRSPIHAGRRVESVREVRSSPPSLQGRTRARWDAAWWRGSRHVGSHGGLRGAGSPEPIMTWHGDCSVRNESRRVLFPGCRFRSPQPTYRMRAVTNGGET